jgi:hypothetical protein
MNMTSDCAEIGVVCLSSRSKVENFDSKYQSNYNKMQAMYITTKKHIAYQQNRSFHK